MKVIDFEKSGNVIRLYLGNDNCNDYWGDDWDDAPYEHNAGIVYGEYVEEFEEFAFPLTYMVQEPADDYYNSPFCKDDFKKKKSPCIIIAKNIEGCLFPTYSKYLNEESDNILKIYYEDNIDELKGKILDFGGVEIPLI